MRNRIKVLVVLFSWFLPFAAVAQIPSGYVQTTGTVGALANGSYGAAWTNLSSSPQLGLLGCVSTFQTTVNGNFDAYGHFSVLLADTSQICPSPSTWTFTFTFACPVGTPTSSFQVQVAVTGGGGTQDISSQITAALPGQSCSGGGGGGVGFGSTNQIAFYPADGNQVRGENLNSSLITGQLTCIGTSGNGAAYACCPPASPSLSVGYPSVILFEPDVSSVAGATLSVCGGSPYPIAPALTTNQIGLFSPPLFLEAMPVRGPNISTWQQVNVSPTSSSAVSSCANTGSATAMVCIASDPGFTLTLEPK